MFFLILEFQSIQFVEFSICWGLSFHIVLGLIVYSSSSFPWNAWNLWFIFTKLPVTCWKIRVSRVTSLPLPFFNFCAGEESVVWWVLLFWMLVSTMFDDSTVRRNSSYLSIGICSALLRYLFHCLESRSMWWIKYSWLCSYYLNTLNLIVGVQCCSPMAFLNVEWSTSVWLYLLSLDFSVQMSYYKDMQEKLEIGDCCHLMSTVVTRWWQFHAFRLVGGFNNHLVVLREVTCQSECHESCAANICSHTFSPVFINSSELAP